MKNHLRTALQRSQRYTKTDMIYLARGGFWTTANYCMQVGAGLITTIALANLLSKETLGTYQYILAVAGIISVFTLSGLGQAITRVVAQGNDGVLRSSVRLKAKWSVGIVVAAGAIASYYFWQDDQTLGLAFLIVGVGAPIIETFRLYQPFLFGKEAFRDAALLGVWRKFLPLVAVVGTAYITTDVLALIAAYFLSNALSYVSVYLSTLRKFKPGYSTDFDTVQQGKHLSVFKIINTGSKHLDKVLIWHFLGPAQVAVYTIAQFAMRYSGGVINSLNSLVLPKLSRRDLPTLQQTLPRKIGFLLVVFVIAALLYVLLIPFVFALAFPAYPEAVPLAQLFALSFLLMPREVLGKVLVAHQQIRAQYILNISTVALRLVLFVTLIPAYDIWGAIYSLLIAEIFNFALAFYLFRHARPVTDSTAKTV